MKLLSCGSNSHGQLGQGNLNDTAIFSPVTFKGPHERVVDLVFGGTHTLALCKGETISTLFGAGSNARGQLGPGSSENRLEFSEITLESLLRCLRIEEESEIKNGGYRIEGIAAAWETSYVHLRGPEGKGDVLLSMGANDWGELGCAVEGNRHVVDIVDFSSLHSSTEVMRIATIAAGPRHIVVQLEIIDAGQSITRKIVGWGASRHRQLGSTTHPSPRTTTLISLIPLPCSTNSLAQISVGRDHTAIKFLIPLPPHQGITKLACGSEHALVLLKRNEGMEAWAWGWNEHGNLGDGSLVDIEIPKRVASSDVGRVVDVWGGNATSWILLDD